MFSFFNRGNQRSTRSRHTARPVQLAIIFLGVYLLGTFVLGFILTRLTIRTQQEALPDHIKLVGRPITDIPRDYYWFLEWLTDPETKQLDSTALADYSGSVEWQNIADSLHVAANDNMVEHAWILTPFGEVIMDETGTPTGVVDQHIVQDPEAEVIRKAAAGEVAEMTFPFQSYRRVMYFPVENKEGRIAALLRLEASDSTMLQIQRVKRRWIGAFGGATVVLVILYILTIRLVNRTLVAERVASQADRLRALGTLAAGIAHEIRNPLGILILQIEELQAMAKTVDDEETKQQLLEASEELFTETNRLKALAEQFTHFSTDKTAGLKPLQRLDLCDEVVKLGKMWSKGTDPVKREFGMVLPENPVYTLFDRDHLRQVLLNLLRNADEALGQKRGEIEIQLTEEGKEAVITVRDSGPGIESRVLNQIFDPFFTTRPEGSGLGLSLSRNLVQSAGGELQAFSEPGQGARFEVRLPVG